MPTSYNDPRLNASELRELGLQTTRAKLPRGAAFETTRRIESVDSELEAFFEDEKLRAMLSDALGVESAAELNKAKAGSRKNGRADGGSLVAGA